MKKIYILIAAFLINYSSIAQNAPQFSLKDIKSKEDLNTAARKASEYILATPADTTAPMRRDAESFLFAWMEKTDEYSFSVDYVIAKMIEENKSEGYVFFAAMAESVFKDKSQNDEQVKINAMKRLIGYSKNSVNNLTPGPELKKAMKAEQKGKLKEYLVEHK